MRNDYSQREVSGPPDSWYDPPCGHDEDCVCDKCHEEHDLLEGVGNGRMCCELTVDELEGKGLWCWKHQDAYMKNKVCLECQAEELRHDL